jgi:hypothetical protein
MRFRISPMSHMSAAKSSARAEVYADSTAREGVEMVIETPESESAINVDRILRVAVGRITV